MPSGGTVTLETTNLEFPGDGLGELPQSALPTGTFIEQIETPRVSEMPCGRYVVFSVLDSGAGRPKAVLERAFEPFLTTREPGKGTGLGLSTVSGIVRQSDGYVVVRSSPGVGTDCRVYLPALQAISDMSDNPVPVSDVRGGTETILVVDDERSLVTMVRLSLERHGYFVKSAHSAQEARALLGQRGMRISLVVTDVIMPGMTGVTLAEHIREIAPEVSFLFMTGYSEESLRAQGIQIDERLLLCKPFSAHDLLARIRNLLDEKAEDWVR